MAGKTLVPLIFKELPYTDWKNDTLETLLSPGDNLGRQMFVCFCGEANVEPLWKAVFSYL